MGILELVGGVFIVLKLFELNAIAVELSWYWLLLIPLWYVSLIIIAFFAAATNIMTNWIRNK